MTVSIATKSARFCMFLLLVSSVGCAHLRGNRPQKHALPPVIPETVPRELQKVTLPDYIIEPPDVLAIDALSIVPLPPYRLSSLDVLMLNVEGTLEGQPIAGAYTVEPGGIIQLGYDYGMVRVGGLTVPEAQEKIAEHLQKTLRQAQVWVSLGQISSEQEIAGEHLVAPDGKVNLGTYGRVRVVGMTIEEADAAIEAHLANYLEDPKISLDVFGYNSKVYYVVTQGAGLGDQVFPVPIKGNETALDAIAQINGLNSTSSKRIWIARPGQNAFGGDQLLPIDWNAITQRADHSTNYQVLPGDRVFIAEDRLVALDNGLAKLVAPVERVFGITLLGTSTVQRLRFFNRTGGFNSGFGGF